MAKQQNKQYVDATTGFILGMFSITAWVFLVTSAIAVLDEHDASTLAYVLVLGGIVVALMLALALIWRHVDPEEKR